MNNLESFFGLVLAAVTLAPLGLLGVGYLVKKYRRGKNKRSLTGPKFTDQFPPEFWEIDEDELKRAPEPVLPTTFNRPRAEAPTPLPGDTAQQDNSVLNFLLFNEILSTPGPAPTAEHIPHHDIAPLPDYNPAPHYDAPSYDPTPSFDGGSSYDSGSHDSGSSFDGGSSDSDFGGSFD